MLAILKLHKRFVFSPNRKNDEEKRLLENVEIGVFYAKTAVSFYLKRNAAVVPW